MNAFTSNRKVFHLLYIVASILISCRITNKDLITGEMLIKPWNEIPAPRHTLGDEVDEATSSPIPNIFVELIQNITSMDYIVISPKNLKVLVEDLPNGKAVGYIKIEYPQIADLQTNEEENDEYDEDEQLYSAVMRKSLIDKYGKLKIPIFQHDDRYLSVNIPHFPNTIANNILARKLTEELDSKITKAWITLSPSLISSNETINKLEVDFDMQTPDIYSAIPSLKPPHFITGIGASFNSQISLLRQPKLMSLVLRSEGQSGFEKIDTDAFVDASFVLNELLVGTSDQENYLKQVSSAVRKINGYSNSGMYI